MKRFAILTVLLALGIGACERHEFEGPNGTRLLHEHGEDHDDHNAHAENARHPGDEFAH